MLGRNPIGPYMRVENSRKGVPTATFRVLFVFVVLSHDRRIVHVNVTAHPSAAWTAQQLREAWPWDTVPRFVIRDRDAVYGSHPRRTMHKMGIQEVLTAPPPAALPRLLSRVAHSPLAEQRYARAAACLRQRVARPSPSHTSAVCITTTNVARPDGRSPRQHS
jgi:hypothetical protein